MKKIGLIFVFLSIFKNSYSQEKLGEPFFTSSLNVTFGRNEYDNGLGDGEPFFAPAAVFLRAGFGYEIKKRVALSLNTGFDYHWNYATSAFPTYAALKYNITEDEGSAFFVEMSYGKMWRPSPKYHDGNYYGFGLGTQVAGAKRWNTIVRLDFHRKGLMGFKNNRLDSVSFGIGFSFF